jgi:hypothetical protein
VPKIRVLRAIHDHGNFKDTKNRRTRSVRILGPLADDLAALRRHRDDSATDLLWPDCHGRPWPRETYANWRERIFQRTATAVGATNATPYELRHTFVSMLIHEGRSPVEVAAQAGHAPTMTLDTYAHVYDDLDPAARVPAESRIARARAAARGADGELVPSQYPQAPRRAALSLVVNNEKPAHSTLSKNTTSNVTPIMVRKGSTVRVRQRASLLQVPAS